jgi:hypothetical protein
MRTGGKAGMTAVAADNAFYNDYQTFEVDSRISYPCYKSFDPFINLKQLRSLNDFLTEKINRHLKKDKQDYFVNLYRLDRNTPYQPGVREIWLSRTKPLLTFDYLDLVGRADLWEPTEIAAAEFGPLMKFIKSLPFEKYGRMLIIFDNEGKEVPAHRDHLNPDVCNEFIWFRTNLSKPFYVMNNETGEKKYVESYSAWFDTVNQYHGSEAAEGLTFSIRVDGVFTDEFREHIPQPQVNPASAPALWTSI